MTIALRQAGRDDAGTVAELVHPLVGELDPDRADAQLLESYRQVAAAHVGADAGYWAILAEAPAEGGVGLITLNECTAIYAGGRFGEIPELYVAPAYRSRGLGALLLEEAIGFATARCWPRLEVGAPDLPRWQRTVDFYQRHGFVNVGPRLKRPLSD